MALSSDSNSLLSLQGLEGLKSARVAIVSTEWNDTIVTAQIAGATKIFNEIENSIEQLIALQRYNGAFSWFKGGPEDRELTQYIIAGIGQLIKLNAIVNPLVASTFDVIHFNYDEYDDFDYTTFNKHTTYDNQEEGFTFLYVTSGDGTLSGSTEGKLYTRKNDSGSWDIKDWNSTIDYIIPPTSSNYTGNRQILSTPYLYYFGLKPGKTAVDKFVKRFGPLGAFPSAE